MHKLKLDLNKQTVSFIILTVVLLIEIFCFLPLGINKLNGLRRKISAVKGRIDAVKNDWPKKDKYVKKCDELKENLDKMKIGFFLLQQEASALAFISSESDKFNIKIESLTPAKTIEYMSTKFGIFRYLPIIIRGRGNFHDLAKFIEYLQTSRYFFEVIGVDVVSESADNSIEMTICGLVKK